MLDRRICNLSPDVKREFKKLYIAYKLDTNLWILLFRNSAFVFL
jgi:predicted transport protein